MICIQRVKHFLIRVMRSSQLFRKFSVSSLLNINCSLYMKRGYNRFEVCTMWMLASLIWITLATWHPTPRRSFGSYQWTIDYVNNQRFYLAYEYGFDGRLRVGLVPGLSTGSLRVGSRFLYRQYTNWCPVWLQVA